jgi:hypothetical protein
MVVNLGYGFLSFSIVILFAMVGTFFYGIIKDYLPH